MIRKVLLIGLIGFSISSFSQNNNDSWLNNSFHTVSTNEENEDYADLVFLKEALKDKNVVAIGEQTHKDGKTFEARSRIIQFLIQEMNFDAIIFESGIYDVAYGWEQFKLTDSLKVFKKSLMEWKSDEQNGTLFEFVETWQKEGNSIEMAGFDCKFTSSYRRKYVPALDSILKTIDSEITNNSIYTNYFEILNEYANATGFKGALPNFSKKETIRFKEGSKLVENTLKSVNHPFYQTTKSINDGILVYSQISLFNLFFSKKKLIKLNNERDVLMAENLNYLLENEYKNKKVILFGATYHFIRNNKQLKMARKHKIKIPESTIMGDLIQNKYKKEIFTIGFAANDGSFGSTKIKGSSGVDIEPAGDGSLEKRLSDLKFKDGILLLNDGNKKPDWFYNDLTIRLFSYDAITSCRDWSKVLDAVFYVEEMDPVLHY